MSIPLPNLDDRRFADLLDEGKRLIPGLAPSWTDHNPSDPGITLIEMFAYLAEMLIYRANRVSEANQRAFVRLLRGPEYTLTRPIDEEIRLAVVDQREELRAITAEDFEIRAGMVDGVARARALPRLNVEAPSPYADAPAHVSLVIVPLRSPPGQQPAATDELRQTVMAELAPRCLLTTRLHVVPARFLPISVRIEAHVFVDQDERVIKALIGQRIRDYFSALVGGAAGTGWPFGQAVYVSELYAMLDSLDGIDYVCPVRTQSGEQPVIRSTIQGRNINENGHEVGLLLQPDELLWVSRLDISVLRETLMVAEG